MGGVSQSVGTKLATMMEETVPITVPHTAITMR
jgi:hypothetical protein